MAFRFPRIARWRADKAAADANACDGPSAARGGGLTEACGRSEVSFTATSFPLAWLTETILALMVTSDTNVTMSAKERVIAAGKFKATCLGLLEEVEAKRQVFVVTKRGRPVARVVPLAADATSSLRGSLLAEEGLLDPVEAVWEAAT